MTPPPAVSVAESMRPVQKPTDSKINRDLLGVMDGLVEQCPRQVGRIIDARSAEQQGAGFAAQ